MFQEVNSFIPKDINRYTLQEVYNMSFIDAKEIRMQALLSNAKEAYRVPLFQRTYSWTRDQWEQLLDDITNLSENDVHFLGSIVVVPEGLAQMFNYFQVIDGQQRLATILIWLSAMRDIAKEKGRNNLANHINETFLFAKDWQSGKEVKIPKLKLGELDNDAFSRVLEGKPRDYKHSIFDCYKFFKETTKEQEEWEKLLNCVSVVYVNAFNHFNAFRLFETLNDRGLELSAADLIKNFLLMRISERDDIFRKAVNEWNEMYEKVRDKEPVKFIRRYILSKFKGKVSEARLYENVRKRYEKEDSEKIASLITDLKDKATVYEKIYNATFTSPKINKVLQKLQLVEVAPSYTLLLKILPYYEENSICEDDVLKVMRMIEIFHIRWGICRQSTNRLDQIYNEICNGLDRKPTDEYEGFIKKQLTEEIEKNVNDEIFKMNFVSRSFKPTETRTKYVLWKLSQPTGETILNIKEIDTEHIMPRRLSDKWIEYLKQKTSQNENEISALHRENINRIGNLTIIKGTWNKSMKNRPFDEKKEDYKNSEFAITNELINHDEWTFNSIEERCKGLAEKALNIWKWD